ncbi:lysine 5,6-aminomutase subunit alpha [Pseudomonadota bacterium]
MPHIPLNVDQVSRVKNLAKQIADQVRDCIADYSTLSVERTVLRLFGVDGVDQNGTPLANRIVDLCVKHGDIGSGISTLFTQALLHSGKDSQQTAELISNGSLDLAKLPAIPPEKIEHKLHELTSTAIAKLDNSKRIKAEKIARIPLPPQPWRYLIVATGDIYEDRTQAQSAVYAGADIVAVIRSTAQSLLDYVPYGPTTEGFGGTYATQANFRIMREALDAESEDQGRYVRLVNYASGLCMPEIAACAAIENLDMLLNDSMYGILFRDINMQRTFVDQHFSRLICARSDIIINTGEDNYLTTSDAIENAHTVTASQLINEAMAKNSRLTDDLLGLGHAFEINPEIENALLYELAHAQLARELFPNAPLKYMPPTKYKSTDVFYSHCMDTLFNLASVTTQQGIHLNGMPTEAIHTPLMQDRYQSLISVNYIFNSAKSLGDEIEFKADGFIVRRAQQVLNETEQLLNDIQQCGLMDAITQGIFADIKRPRDGGKGADGVFKKGPDYANPIMDQLEASA